MDSPPLDPMRTWLDGARRIVVVGNSGSGKSTTGAALAAILGVPWVELDALHWAPGWVEVDDATMTERLRAETTAERFVVSGNYYKVTWPALWPRLDAVLWLDLPLSLVLVRLVRRIWQRWRSQELLWGTNRERLLPQFKLWDKESSLLTWAVTSHAPRRRTLAAVATDPRWGHLRVLRLRSAAEVDRLLAIARERAVAPG